MKTMHPLILNSALAIALLTGTALCPNAFAAEPGAQAEAPKPAAQGEMIAGGDGTKLFLRRDLPDGDVRAVLVIVHGLANHHGLYDEFVKPFGGHGIAVYRYDARGHGRSEGRRGYVKSYWEMVDDLRAVVALAKKERPGKPVYVLGHSMGGHVSALHGTKYPGEASGYILCAGVLRYHFMNFGWLPRPEDPESEISPVDAAYGTLHLPGWKELSTFSAEGDDGTLKSISVSILNAFTEGIAYLKKNCKSFTDPVLVLTGNNDMCVSPQDAIDFYQETGSTDRSLRIYAGVGHFLMAEEKGHMIAPEIITWIEDRLSGGQFVDAGI
ncbi:MAG: lysophospholipase [Kiritimatiellae bacterium]|nr:lysophospholipase [Kiritimatiellia bacterium]